MSTTSRHRRLRLVMALFSLITALTFLAAPAQARGFGCQLGHHCAYDPGLSAGGQEHTMEGRGWTHLSAGRFSQALYSFAHQASRKPTEGAAKVGYALSAAACLVGKAAPAGRLSPRRRHGRSRAGRRVPCTSSGGARC